MSGQLLALWLRRSCSSISGCEISRSSANGRHSPCRAAPRRARSPRSPFDYTARARIKAIKTAARRRHGQYECGAKESIGEGGTFDKAVITNPE